MYDKVDENPRMREVDRTTPVQDSYPPSVREAMLVHIPPSDIVSSSKPYPSVPPIDTQPEPPIFQATDNFDSHTTLLSTTTPVGPSLSSAATTATGVPDAVPSSSSVVTPIVFNSSESGSSSSQAATEEPQPSVRLVGGGGIMGDVLLVDDVAETPDASGLSKKNSLDMSSSIGKRKTEAV